MKLSDRTTGLFLVGLGTVAAYAGSRLPPVPGQQVGPNVFPLVVGVGLAVCGLMIALGVGRKFEEEAAAELAAHSDSAAEAPRAGWSTGILALLPPALLLFYVYAVDFLGFMIAGFVIVLAGAAALGARWTLALPLAALAPVGVHLVFAKLLRVPLPAGLLPMLW